MEFRELSSFGSLDTVAREGSMANEHGKLFWVYMMASTPRGVLYVGLTSNLAGRSWQHREEIFEGFTKRYNVTRLVYFERHFDGTEAGRRERAMKRWRRDWKIELVEKNNPTWRDLFADVAQADGFAW